MDTLFQESLIEAARSPKHYGRLTRPTVSAAEVNASCGDVISVDLKLDSVGKIEAVGWVGEGCVISRAAMSELSERLIGTSRDEVVAMGIEDMESLLGIGEISPGRRKCLLIGLAAVQRALTSLS